MSVSYRARFAVDSPTFAFDVHMHIIPLQHACLSSFVELARERGGQEVFALASAKDYIAKGVLSGKGDVFNLLNAMERTPADEIALYEDDLRGAFGGGARAPVLGENGIAIDSPGKHLSYDYLVLCPQIMDFNADVPLSVRYKDAPRHDLFKQAAQILDGIAEYRQARPKSRVIVRPFIGINPLLYEPDFIRRLLETCFGKKSGWNPRREKVLADWKLVGSRRAGQFDETHLPYKNAFAGIKLYPPMGFDPYPDDASQREKTEILFSFCEEHGVPLVTHCDDQGFRTVSLEDSFKYTSPERWERVLAAHPRLYVDFAHFGQQYYKGLGPDKERSLPQKLLDMMTGAVASWHEHILRLMTAYPHVYSDFSFSGTKTDIWKWLRRILDDSGKEARDRYAHRLLFGTDWPLCLTKIPGALEYWRDFADSPLSADLCHLMLSENPQNFLFR